jgi:large subunit ribosomal protein L15e
MVKGLAYYLRQAWKKPEKEITHSRLIQWRASNSLEKVEKPLRIDRARSLGYKAKEGVIVVRVRINRGGRKRERAGIKGRKSRKQTVRKTLKMNYKWVAEIRAARKFKNLEVLNSYPIGKDGKHYYFEVILVDPSKIIIKKDRTLKWISSDKNRKRAERGKTSSARKSRGLRNKSPENKVRPGVRSTGRRGK